MASLQHVPSLMWQRQLESLERMIKAGAAVDQSRGYPFGSLLSSTPAPAPPPPPPAPQSAHKSSPLQSPNANAFNPFAMLVNLLQLQQQQQQQQASQEQQLAAETTAAFLNGAGAMLTAKETPKWPFVWSPGSAAASGAVSPFVDHNGSSPHELVSVMATPVPMPVPVQVQMPVSMSVPVNVAGLFCCPVCGCKVSHGALAEHFREELELLETHFTSLGKLKDCKSAASANAHTLHDSLCLPKVAQGFDAACSAALSEKRYQAFLHVRSNRQRRNTAKSHRKRSHEPSHREAASSGEGKCARLSENGETATTSCVKQSPAHAPQSSTPVLSGSESGDADKDACDYIDVLV